MLTHPYMVRLSQIIIKFKVKHKIKSMTIGSSPYNASL